MKRFLTFGSLMAAVLLTGNSFATDLETEAQKLGYIIGMDIGSSLKQQGTELDLDTLYESTSAQSGVRKTIVQVLSEIERVDKKKEPF